mgnify:CR=1 FL=1
MKTTLPHPASADSWFHRRLIAAVLVIVAALVLAIAPRTAHAVDGCKVLLCFAAPSWRAIPQCVPPIREVLRDLARGRPFPSCAMAGVTPDGTGAGYRTIANAGSHGVQEVPHYHMHILGGRVLGRMLQRMD